MVVDKQRERERDKRVRERRSEREIKGNRSKDRLKERYRSSHTETVSQRAEGKGRRSNKEFPEESH